MMDLRLQEAMANFDEHWNVGFLHARDIFAPVHFVLFAAFTNEDNTPGANGIVSNHWCLYLVTGSHSSIRLDMAPGPGKLAGVLEASSEPQRLVADEAIHVVSAEVQAGLTFSDFVDLVVAGGRHRYTFTDAAEGCRYWTTVVAQDLEDACYVPQGSAKNVLDAVSMYWAHPSGSTPLAITQGTFEE